MKEIHNGALAHPYVIEVPSDHYTTHRVLKGHHTPIGLIGLMSDNYVGLIMVDNELRQHFVHLRTLYNNSILIIAFVFISFSITLGYDLGDKYEAFETCNSTPLLEDLCQDLERAFFINLIWSIIFLVGGIAIYFQRFREPWDMRTIERIRNDSISQTQRKKPSSKGKKKTGKKPPIQDFEKRPPKPKNRPKSKIEGGPETQYGDTVPFPPGLKKIGDFQEADEKS